MYVCICNAIRERDLREATLRCDGDAEEIYAFLGKTPQCRQCLEDANEIVNEERALARALIDSGVELIAA